MQRLLLASAASFGVFLFTAKPILVREMWCRIFVKIDLKTGMRRLAWYSSKSWMQFQVFPDPVFNFSEGLEVNELFAIKSFLATKKQSEEDYHLDRLTLLASEAKWPSSRENWSQFMIRFASDVDALFACLHAGNICKKPLALPTARKSDFSVESASRALADFATLFPNEKYPWYVISGTFLGLIRDGNFLPHDYDIDVGMNIEAVDVAFVVKLVGDSKNFFLSKYDRQPSLKLDANGSMSSTEIPTLLKLVHVSGLHVDLFFHYLDGNIRWHGSSVHRWENTEFQLAPYSLADVDLLGPADANRYLTENYGNWRIPVTDFNSSTGTPNLKMAHNLESLVLFLRRYALAYQKGIPEADERIEDLLLQGGYIGMCECGPYFDTSSFDNR
ncbi:LicD family protein [Tateyamaria sp.]|nr:LicD family protein [Tateyamaria sp.]